MRILLQIFITTEPEQLLTYSCLQATSANIRFLLASSDISEHTRDLLLASSDISEHTRRISSWLQATSASIHAAH
ncbi:unnamed protein product [Rodentolepis nana]|uniref:DUF3475 domain-containing protein n=1 Tax=Rodentolepis nana TaxID=102285 RepID=A0A0R3T614_RODNA|nr:unnamed protein product [Rodentolepis nana]